MPMHIHAKQFRHEDLLEVLNHLDELVFIWQADRDAGYSIVWLNEKSRNVLPVYQTEPVPEFSSFVVPGVWKRWKQCLAEVQKSGETIKTTDAFALSDQHEQQYALTFIPLYNEQTVCTHIVQVSRTEDQPRSYNLQQLQSEIWKNEINAERFHILSHHSKDMMAFIDHTGMVSHVSPSHENKLGVSLLKLIGRFPQVYEPLVHPADRPKLAETFQDVVQLDKTVSLQVRMLLNWSVWGWFDFEVSPVRNLKSTHHCCVLFIREITEHKKKEEEIKQLAFYDALTLLPNRRLFQDRFSMMLTNAKRDKTMFALLFLDCDGLKQINDTLGHEAGDLFLKEFARRLKACTRNGDTVARIGGDEFVILVGNVKHEEQVQLLIKRILEQMESAWKYKEIEVNISTSIGIALYPRDGEDQDSLLYQADQAMYREKLKRNPSV